MRPVVFYAQHSKENSAHRAIEASRTLLGSERASCSSVFQLSLLKVPTLSHCSTLAYSCVPCACQATNMVLEERL